MKTAPAVLTANRVHPVGRPELARPTYCAAGLFRLHRSFNAPRAWAVSLPNGAALGCNYPSRNAAKAAAAAMAPLVYDWHALDLAAVFGSMAAARAAYDAARQLAAS